MRGVTRMEEGAGRTLTVTLDDVRRLVAACRVSRNRKLAALLLQWVAPQVGARARFKASRGDKSI